MKKFTKWAGVSILIFTFVSLLHKGSIKEYKTEIINLRQLINRLFEQMKNCKGSLNRLTTAFHKINLTRIQNNLNDFTHEITPRLNKIQSESTQFKKDFKH